MHVHCHFNLFLPIPFFTLHITPNVIYVCKVAAFEMNNSICMRFF